MSWRQHHGHAHTPAPLDSEKPDLSYKPGMSGASAKERAKELRKYAEQRGMVKEAKRKEKELEVARQKQEMAASSASADTQKEKERPICSFFLQGKCNKGSKCKFQHVAPAAETTAAQDGPAADLDLVAKLPADMWLQIFSRLTVVGVCSMARSCTALAACAENPEVWEEKRRQVFGSEPQEAGPDSEAEVGAVGAVGAVAQSSSSGSVHRAGGKPVGKSVGAGSTPRPLAKPSARLECCMSESSLQGWARPASSTAAATELPLAEAQALAITGKLGFSLHEGKMLRLWEARSGRRLGARTLPRQPVACDAGRVGAPRSIYKDETDTHAYAAVGDVSGTLHVMCLDDGLDATGQVRPFAPRRFDPSEHGPSRCLCGVALLSDRPTSASSSAATTARSSRAALQRDGSDVDDDEDDSDGGDGDSDGDGGDGDGGDGDGGDGGQRLCVASAYRDGAICLSTIASNLSSWTVAWQGTLRPSPEGALSFSGFGDLGHAGGLVRHWRPDGEMALVSLADGGSNGALYATYRGMACSIDVESGVQRWSSGPPIGPASEDDDILADILDGLQAMDALDIGDDDDDDAAAMEALEGLDTPLTTYPRPQQLLLPQSFVGARQACYSPGWNLLAATCRRTVTLWDERLPAKTGPVARFSAPISYENAASAAIRGGGGRGGGGAGGGPAAADFDGGCVHIDSGLDGCWSGHLLHLPPGPDRRIHLYDIRRLGRRRTHGASGGVAALVKPSLLASITSSRRDRPIGGCFAAGADGLIAAVGGPKSTCSLRWPVGRVMDDGRRGGGGIGGGGGGGSSAAVEREEEEAAAEEELKEAKAKAREEAKEKKKRRLVTKGGGMKMKQGSSNRTG